MDSYATGCQAQPMRASRLVAKCDKVRASNQQQKRGPAVEHQQQLQHRKRHHHRHSLLGGKRLAKCGGSDWHVFVRRRILSRVTREAQSELSQQAQSLVNSTNGKPTLQTGSGDNGLLSSPENDQFVLRMPNENCLLLVHKSGEFQLWRRKNEKLKQVTSGQLSLPEAARSVKPEVQRDESDGSAWIQWDSHAVLKVRAIIKKDDDDNEAWKWAQNLSDSFAMSFYVSEPSQMAEVTFDLKKSGFWFGGGHLMNQHWPLNNGLWEIGPFLPFDNGPNGQNTLMSPQFYSTSGLLLMVDPDTPFFHFGLNSPAHKIPRRQWGTGIQNAVKEHLPRLNGSRRDLFSINRGDGQARIQNRRSFRNPRIKHNMNDIVLRETALDKEVSEALGESGVGISFVVGGFLNVKDAVVSALKTFKKPRKPPPKSLMQKPIWTTWARYKAAVKQSDVESYAEEIVNSGCDRSVMEIDDRWQSAYGDLQFDSKKFPNPKEMVDKLHSMGFQVTLWVMPFAVEDSEAYRYGAKRGYFIKGRRSTGKKSGFFNWWNPQSVVALDVTNMEAVDWFVNRLKNLQTLYGIDGFKFDAGEPCFLPQGMKSQTPLTTPTEYTRLYIERIASKFAVAEARTGFQTQSVSIFTRMGDRFSSWPAANGLRSLIPTLLTSGLLGYPFCLPDMVGGNAYFGQRPDKELLVRWAQVNALMPAVQFSIAPWDYGKDTMELCNAAMDVRRAMSKRILSLAEDACRHLAPIARPMWWLDPEDKETWNISDQFVLGDDLIVAPVVYAGHTERDIYLPLGRWKDLNHSSRVFQGGKWLRGYKAPLGVLPIFGKTESH